MFLKRYMHLEVEIVRWLMFLTIAAALILAFASQVVGKLEIWT